MASPKAVVLVVEDDPLLRLSATDITERAGFEVESAASFHEAIAVLERRADIRIIFTDIEMPPGPDGMNLAAMVRDRWPPTGAL